MNFVPGGAPVNPFVGLRWVNGPTPGNFYSGSHFTSTEKGCQCEGWGIASGTPNPLSPHSPFPCTDRSQADVSVGTFNVVSERFQVDVMNNQAISTVRAGGGKWRVIHDYHPSLASPFLFEVLVTIENLTPKQGSVLMFLFSF